MDGLLNAWAAQESRSPNIDHRLSVHEPTSFPFPIFQDVVSPPPVHASIDAATEAGSLTCPSLDFDDVFGDFDQTSLLPEYGLDSIIDSWSVSQGANNSLAATDNLQLGTEFLSDAMMMDTMTQLDALEPLADGSCLPPSQHPFDFGSNLEDCMMHDIYAMNTVQPDTTPQPEILYPDLTTSNLQGQKDESLASSMFIFAASEYSSRSDSQQRTLPPVEDQHYSHDASNHKRQRVQELQHNNRLQYRDDTGVVVGTELVLGDYKPVRKRLSPSDKAMTNATRRRGACDTCRLNKKRCNRPDDPLYECCFNCVKSKVLSMPCFMAKIIEAQLFRDRPSPKHPRSSLRQAVFGSLTDIVRNTERQRPIIVTLTQDLGLQLLVRLARYEPEAGESTHRMWKKGGQTQRIDLPPYCIANIQDAQKSMLEYIINFRSAFLKHVLGRSNEITRGLFDQAQRFAAFNPDSTVSKALDLCAASRIIERDWRICGKPSDLGITLVSDDPSNPFYDFVPITPMMDAQLDQIVIQSFLVPTRDALLKSLHEKMTSPSNASSFFEIFLTVAVLLSHSEWLLSHSRQNAIRVGSKTRYNHNPRAESYFHACNTIIAHWHYLCRGASFSEMNWRKESVRKWANLDLEQVDYLTSLQRKINHLESQAMMSRLRQENRYEEELYWCHQLFFPNWTASARTVKEITTT